MSNIIYKTNTDVVPIIRVGMYDSCLTADNLFSYVYEGEDGEEFDYDHFDYAAYKKAVGEAASEVVEKQSKCFFDPAEDGIVRVFSDGGISSPRFYNFETDELNIDIEVTPDFKTKMKRRFDEWIAEGKEGRVWKYAEENYKSRDGFDSFVPYRLDEIRDKIIADIDVDRLVGCYAELVLVDRRYFDRGEYDPSPEEVAYQELIEKMNERYYDEFIVEDEPKEETQD